MRGRGRPLEGPRPNACPGNSVAWWRPAQRGLALPRRVAVAAPVAATCAAVWITLALCIPVAATAAAAAAADGALPAWFLEGPPAPTASAGAAGGATALGPGHEAGRGGRQLRAARRQLAAAHCGPLSADLVASVAQQGVVMLTVLDKLVWRAFGPSFVENVAAAGIDYSLIAALDPETSLALGAAGVGRCFNAPMDRLKYRGADSTYTWGSHHWKQTTWNKVHVLRAVYELGVGVIHSDADVVWFGSPLSYFLNHTAPPPGAPPGWVVPHVLVGIDSLATGNKKGEVALERDTHPFTNINTGVYYLRQWPGGRAFLDAWLAFQDKDVGHDQDGFNYVARGGAFRQDPGMQGPARAPGGVVLGRAYLAAFSNTTAIAYLPPSSFANTYTYVNARLWQLLDHPLYSVHFVWGGSTLESKRQVMRDAMKFHDDPAYYSDPDLVTFDLEQLPMPDDYNSWQNTEEMIRFHAEAANHQLQQAYAAFAIALIANRTLVMPRFLCYCSKNWYQTQRCRINYETATVFPFVCSLSQLMRVKRLQQGLSLPGSTQYSGHVVHIREHSFMDNPKVPHAIKRSYLELVPSPAGRPPGLPLDSPPESLVVTQEPAPNRTAAAGGGSGVRLTLAAPLTDGELRALLARYGRPRVLHVPRPARLVSGFSRPDTSALFDAEIQKRVTYWCCRSPPSMKAFNLSDKLQLVALPPGHYGRLPPSDRPHPIYLHQLGPIPRMPGGQVV